MTEVIIGERRIELARLDKVLWPEVGFTKGDLIDYYRAVGSVLLPHLVGHPLTLARFPDGIDAAGFYQQECRGAPDWLPVAPLVARNGRVFRYCMVDDLASLLWVANLATIELHPLVASLDEPDHAPVVVFDLDPGPPAGLLEACGVALELRAALAEHGLTGFAKTSGGRGLHVFVPVAGRRTFEETRRFARGMAASLRRRHPERIVETLRIADRTGKVLVDWRQNHARLSMVAPYSLRAQRRPMVSAPVAWDELERAWHDRDARLLVIGPTEILGRIEARGDLFRPVLEPPPGGGGHLPLGGTAETH